MRWSGARAARVAVGTAVLVAAAVYLVQVVSGPALATTLRVTLADPAGLVLALACYAAAFVLRTWTWTLALPGLGAGQAWAGLHVSLLGNHVLPLRLGEVLRVTSVTRRTPLPGRPVVASALFLRSADLLAVLLLAAATVPALVGALAGIWVWPIAAVLAAVTTAGLVWLRRLQRRECLRGGIGAARPRLPWPSVTLPAIALPAAAVAWALEAAVVLQIARTAGLDLSPYEAVVVTAVTIAAQTVAVTPGGIGSYEAAATAALAALGAPADTAFAVALVTHAVKTVYALAVGGVALFVPAPTYWGRLRLPRVPPARPPAVPLPLGAPVVTFIPVYDEEATVGEVVSRLPSTVAGRPLVVLVVDDGSTDASAARAARAGARVIAQPRNLGLGAAVRRGLAEATALGPAAVVYLDADGEYFPEDIETVAGPVLSGEADYVVGSRFAGEIRRMLPHRRLGNRVLTRWVRWLTRRHDITDGQSGYRAFSPAAAAAAEVIHDYNYAQVLTLDLLAKGYVYREVPIRYAFRETGTSFVKLGRYLRKVVPAVHRELNAPSSRPAGTPSG